MRVQACAMDAVSLGANAESRPILFENIIGMSIQSIITGTPVGELKLQCCNSLTDDADEIPAGDWMDYANSAIAISGATKEMHELENSDIKWFKLVYTRTSGTGSITSNRYSRVET